MKTACAAAGVRYGTWYRWRHESRESASTPNLSDTDDARARVFLAAAPSTFDDVVPAREFLAKALASIDDLRRQLNARRDPDESPVRHSAEESEACPTPMCDPSITVYYWLTLWNQPGPLLGHLRTRSAQRMRP